MALIVQKYGGSSLESADRIRAVAERIVATKKQELDKPRHNRLTVQITRSSVGILHSPFSKSIYTLLAV